MLVAKAKPRFTKLFMPLSMVRLTERVVLARLGFSSRGGFGKATENSQDFLGSLALSETPLTFFTETPLA